MNGGGARTPGLLEAIVAATRTIVASRREQMPATDLARVSERKIPRGRRFREALSRPGRVNIIAECKRRSPARGVLAHQYDPAVRAARYAAGGAAAVSVLTEPTFFDGSLAHLAAVRASVDLPILRKDFIVDEYQLLEARAHGADAVLLIVAALTPAAMRSLSAAAAAIDLAVLVEVHTREELSQAVDAGASIIGVNSRNLRTLEVDLSVCERLAPHAPRGVVLVAESGVATAADVSRLGECGYRACLVGERLMTAADPAAALSVLTGADPLAAGRGRERSA